MITLEQTQAFDRDGFLLIEDFFSASEVKALIGNLETDRVAGHHLGSMVDKEGRESKISFWTDIGGDIFGAVSASARVVNAAQILLREEVYHWHSKVMLKEPKVGGAWEWHQDYGYWYNDGCLAPRLISAMLSLDPANKQNGCLKVLVGSHRIGRIDHGQMGGQTGADPERLRAIEELFEVKYVETRPGAMLFFHCNLLHSSEANLSDYPRRAYICCYNAFSNAPYGGRGHGEVKPIKTIPDESLSELLAS